MQTPIRPQTGKGSRTEQCSLPRGWGSLEERQSGVAGFVNSLVSGQGQTPFDQQTAEPRGAGLQSEDVPPGYDRVRLGPDPQRENCPLLAHQDNLGQWGFCLLIFPWGLFSCLQN